MTKLCAKLAVMSKLIGSILLIVGTCIGAGMLALPIATAKLGFLGSLVLLFAVWFVMTASAFYILEVNLWMPQNSNLISMSRATIGPIGQIISWINFLLMLYCLLCAYIAGGSDLLHSLLGSVGLQFSQPISAILFTLLLGYVVFLGIHAVDHTNRILMFIKLGAYGLLVLFLLPHVSLEKLAVGQMKEISSTTAIMVTIASFGYATIIPSLRIYFAGDVKKLKKAILIGSLIPLVCYIFWDMVIMGVIPLDDMLRIMDSKTPTSELSNTLSAAASQGAITLLTKIFTSIAVVTSFLGVALCLTDFLSDGLQLEKVGINKLIILGLTFLPPVLVVLFYPSIFVKAFAYAGIYSIVLLMLLPAWMAWGGRYQRKIAAGYRVPGGKVLNGAVILISVGLLILSVVG